ncbi:MAG TPA: hypothetical protein VGX51_09385 [Solirubrobacteraceae bacterium]|nr:hypothetical protein [Solirubrobacteraceae bacterium]
MSRKAKLIAGASLCLAAMIAGSANAQAAPLWEVWPPWHVLPVNQVETLSSKGMLMLWEVGKTTSAKCKITDTEVIENVAGSGGAVEAIDSMTAFNGTCVGAATYPCVAGEHFTVNGGKWPSRLIGAVEDEFFGAELEVNCPVLGLKEFYVGTLHPVLTVNKLTFNGPASGVLKAGIHEIYFTGVDKLKPTGVWKRVR